MSPPWHILKPRKMMKSGKILSLQSYFWWNMDLKFHYKYWMMWFYVNIIIRVGFTTTVWSVSILLSPPWLRIIYILGIISHGKTNFIPFFKHVDNVHEFKWQDLMSDITVWDEIDNVTCPLRDKNWQFVPSVTIFSCI